MKKASTAMSSTLRCLKVLEFLAEEPFELSFTDLAAKLDIPKGSAHRLCTTLIEANLITQQPVTRRYILSSHALWVGSGYLRHSPLYRAAFFPMQELARQVPGTVQLGVLDQDYVLFIHSVGYSGAQHAFADVGLRRPLNATASGKIFLAGMAPGDLEYVMTRRAEKYTSSTITCAMRATWGNCCRGTGCLPPRSADRRADQPPQSVLRCHWKNFPRRMRRPLRAW
jgi:DNA-binding IclR family transcriptional regulator